VKQLPHHAVEVRDSCCSSIWWNDLSPDEEPDPVNLQRDPEITRRGTQAVLADNLLQPLVQRQRFQHIGDVGGMQTVEQLLQRAQMLAMHQRLDQLVARTFLSADQILHQLVPVQQLDDLLSKVQVNSNYQRAIAAQENFDKTMLQVNNWITEGIRKGATSSIITLG
jgi:hypothetical protein